MATSDLMDKMVTEKMETDKNWMLTEAEKQGLHVSEGVNVSAARLR